MKVLVADGSPEERARVSDALGELSSFHVQGQVANLEGALRSLAGNAPDLLVTEAHFSDGDGVGLIEAARRHLHGPAVVVFTAVDSADLRKRCLEAGADLVVPKQSGVVELQRLVADLAAGRSAARVADVPANADRTRDRFSIIGRIAGGVAHDLSNYFAVMNLSLHGLGQHVAPAGAAELEEARAALAAASGLTKLLLDYARGGTPAPTAVELGPLVLRTVELVRRLIPCGVKLHMQIDEAVPSVNGVAIELEQLLLNLVLNACDAMPRGGELWLALRRSSPTSVTLEVADSGLGPSEELARGTGTTTPSSKVGRHGDGLGLGIVRSVVERHGATLLIGPRTGGGTRVLVRLSAD